MNWSTPRNKKATVKRRVVIHNDRDILRSAVINNLVPEDRREIIFSTQFPEDQSEPSETENEYCDSKYLKLEQRIEKIELIVKRLVEYLVKDKENVVN